VKRALALILALTAGTALAGSANQLYLIKPDGNAAPLARIVSGGFESLSLGDDETGMPPRSLHVYLGARHAGKVKVGAAAIPDGTGCGDGESLALAPLAGSEVPASGLATSLPLNLRPARPEIAVTPADLRALSQLASAWMEKHGVKRKDRLAALKTLEAGDAGQVVAASINYDNIDANQMVTLFFLAEKGAGGQFSLVYGDSYVGPHGEAEKANKKYLEHLDLDADGVDEVVISGSAYESWFYSILKRQDGKWVEVHSQDGGGC
jgi:hypothetical protein